MRKLVEKACKYLSVLKEFDLEEFEIESNDVKLKFSTGQSVIPAGAPVVSVPNAVDPLLADLVATEKLDSSLETTEVDEEAYATIASPIVGTFYRRPAPDKPTFIEVGQEVKTDQPVCIVEAMKLMNEIKSHINGRIVKILVKDSEPVQAGQVLFLIEPV